MSLINDIKRDREAGTPGPWMADGGDGEIFYNDGDVFPWVCCINFDNTPNAQALADCERIARVPDMEAALLAAEGLAFCVKALDDPANEEEANEIYGAMLTALADFRKATGDTQ